MSEKDTLSHLIYEASNDLRLTVEDTPQELFEQRPGPHQNPAGFIYFHVLRHWDRDLNILCKHQPLDGDAWHRGGFSELFDYEPMGKGSYEMGTGFGYTDAEVDATPKDLAGLMRYHQMLHDETFAYLDSVDDETLNVSMTSEHSYENPYKPERWLRHMIAHTFMHVGDIQYVQGVLGMTDFSYPGPD